MDFENLVNMCLHVHARNGRMYFFILIDFAFFLLIFLAFSNERNDRMYFSIFLDFDKQKQAK